MEEELYEDNKISKYNDAGLSISRLHDSWIICKHCIRVGNFKKWKIELDNIWLELIPDVIKKKNKKDGLYLKNKKLMLKIAKSKNKSKLFFNLMERHAYLREVQDMAGKAGVYRDENEEGFE